jgi:hypothetical protein
MTLAALLHLRHYPHPSLSLSLSLKLSLKLSLLLSLLLSLSLFLSLFYPHPTMIISAIVAIITIIIVRYLYTVLASSYVLFVIALIALDYSMVPSFLSFF